MVFRSIVLCLYLASLYGLSHQMDELRMVFYPTLGAFGYLFLVRSVKEMFKIVSAAVLAVTVGSLLYALSSGMLSFFVTAIMAVMFIQKLRLNAAPVVAVSFVPFFANPADIWSIPLSICGSLLGLMLTMVLAAQAQVVVRLLAQWKLNPFRTKSARLDVAE